MIAVDVKLFIHKSTRLAWRDDYPTVWDAIRDAQGRAETMKAEVLGIHAMRAPAALPGPSAKLEPEWKCACGQTNPPWNFKCDHCGEAPA